MQLHSIVLSLIFLNLTFVSSFSFADKSPPEQILSRKIGKLAIYSSKYIFPLRLYEDDILGQYASLHAQFIALYELIEPNIPQNLTGSIVDVLLEELQEFKHDYFHSVRSVSNLFTWDVKAHPSREKRGLFNGGGSILNFLLGTAEQSDIDSLNGTLSKVFLHAQTQDVEINLHTEILNVTTQKINKINIVQKKLSNLILELDQKLQSEDNFSRIIESNMYNSNAFSSLILALMNLNQKTSTLREGIISMVSGKLSPAIIDNAKMQELLQIIRQKGHSLLVNENDIALNFYYDISSVNSIFDHKTSSILFLVTIPINLFEQQVFDLYRNNPLYTSTSVNDIFAMYKIKQYLAENNDGSIIELDNMLDCQRIEKVYVCGLTMELSNQPEKSCSYRLMNKIEPYHPICHKQLFKLHKPTFRLINRVWYYTIPEPLTLNIHCFDKVTQRSNHVQTVTLSGAGQMELDHGCTASSPEIRLLASSRNFFHKKLNISIIKEYLPNYSVINKLEQHPLSRKLNIRHILDGTETTDLNDLTSNLQILNGLDDSYSADISFYLTITYASLFISFLALILIIAIVLVMVAEYQQDIGDDDLELENFSNFQKQQEKDEEIIFDLSDGYYNIQQRKPIYENDIGVPNTSTTSISDVDMPTLVEVQIHQNPIYMEMDLSKKETIV